MKHGQFGTVHAGGHTFKHYSPRGAGPWLNWHIGRKRMSLRFTDADLRRISWRRTL